jgi:hypothetical protein
VNSQEESSICGGTPSSTNKSTSHPLSVVGSQADVDIWIGIIKNKMHLNICTLRNLLFEVVSAFSLNGRSIRFRRVLVMAMKIDKISSTVKRNVTF